MTSLLLAVLELSVGIGLLFGGGEFFVRGSVALAKILKIPQLVIGLTIVSIGTSAPELFVSINSFLKGSDALAVSNVVGSNIFNVLVVLGSSALILPLKVESRLIRRDVPLLLAVSAAVWGMASSGEVTWQAGSALLLALLINTIWEIRTVKEDSNNKKETLSKPVSTRKAYQELKAGIALISGVILLTIGSNLLVSGASTIAKSLGISEVIIGLTIVSAGTSMPELITSLVATIRGRTDLAIGNVVGSSLLNQLLVLSSCALISGGRGLQVDELLIQKDIPIMVLSILACMPIFWTKGIISRIEGASLLGIYFLYLIDQLIPHTYPEIHDNYRFIILCLILPLALIIITFKTITKLKDDKENNLINS
tara:strand:+ start:1308 stop:2411 length:1104 start_codon:yes stop_codon:yes gene_type:complete